MLNPSECFKGANVYTSVLLFERPFLFFSLKTLSQHDICKKSHFWSQLLNQSNIKFVHGSKCTYLPTCHLCQCVHVEV